MFKEIICRSCDGNGCVNCCGNGVRYVEINDPIPSLQDEISELKEALETSKNEFNILLEASNDFAKSKDEVRLWNENESLKRQLEIAKEALNKIGGKQLEQIAGMYEFIAESALEEIESAGE